jgi:hypothetical protein
MMEKVDLSLEAFLVLLWHINYIFNISLSHDPIIIVNVIQTALTLSKLIFCFVERVSLHLLIGLA